MGKFRFWQFSLLSTKVAVSSLVLLSQRCQDTSFLIFLHCPLLSVWLKGKASQSKRRNVSLSLKYDFELNSFGSFFIIKTYPKIFLTYKKRKQNDRRIKLYWLTRWLSIVVAYSSRIIEQTRSRRSSVRDSRMTVSLMMWLLYRRSATEHGDCWCSCLHDAAAAESSGQSSSTRGCSRISYVR